MTDRQTTIVGRTLRAVSAVVLVLYPVGMYLGLTHWRMRTAAVVLLIMAAPSIAVRMPRDRNLVSLLALIPIIPVGALAVTSILDARGAILMAPVGVNLVLLIVFGGTLATATPMIERFARLQDPDLTGAEVRWCRHWTVIWCVFFAANAIVAALLAVHGPMQAWAIYNGGLAYALIGALVAVEWVLRKRRFGRWGSSRLSRRMATWIGKEDPR